MSRDLVTQENNTEFKHFSDFSISAIFGSAGGVSGVGGVGFSFDGKFEFFWLKSNSNEPSEGVSF